MGIHFFMFKFLITKDLVAPFVYNYHSVNLLFIITSFITISVLYLLSKKNNEYLGFIYLGFSTLKTILCYALLHEVLGAEGDLHQFEKFNIILLFFFFMGIEVYQTSKVLNKISYKSKD